MKCQPARSKKIYHLFKFNIHLTWTDWCSEYGVPHIPTTAFHPQANGMHRQLKGALRVRGGAVAWANHLPWVMLGIQASPKGGVGYLSG